MENNLGSRIRELRKQRDLTQAQLAERAGLDHRYVSALEKGRVGNPGTEMLERLARAFDVPVSELLGETSEAASPFPASQLREWGISEPDLDQYRAAWPYWSHDQRVKFLGSLQLIINVRANVQAMTDEVQAKVRALENRANQDDDPDSAAQPFAQQVAM